MTGVSRAIVVGHSALIGSGTVPIIVRLMTPRDRRLYAYH